MKPERELDALIAEKAMELNTHWLGDGVEVNILSIGESGVEVPCFSTDIAAAWEVVEKLTGDVFQLSWVIEGDGNRPVGVSFWAGDTFYTAEAATAPYAICLAALKVIEND